jgi:vitamin B12 transporter
MDFIASAKIIQGSLSVEASVTNLFDASYSYMEGYPAPGRQFNLGLRYELR